MPLLRQRLKVPWLVGIWGQFATCLDIYGLLLLRLGAGLPRDRGVGPAAAPRGITVDTPKRKA